MIESLLNKFEFLQRIFKKEKDRDKSGEIAKERLKLVLIHDKSTINPQLFELLRIDILKTINRYMVVNEQDIEMGIDTKNGTTVLAASIPIIKIKSPRVSDLTQSEPDREIETVDDYKFEEKIQPDLQEAHEESDELKTHKRLRKPSKKIRLRSRLSHSQAYRRIKKRKKR